MAGDGQEINVDRITLTIGDNIVIDEDRTSNILKKYYSPDREIFWGYDGSGVSFNLGSTLERMGFTGGLCLVKGPFLMTVFYTLPDATARTLYTNIEYYTELEVYAAEGRMLTNEVY